MALLPLAGNMSLETFANSHPNYRLNHSISFFAILQVLLTLQAWISLGRQLPIDRLRIDYKMVSKLIDGEKARPFFLYLHYFLFNTALMSGFSLENVPSEFYILWLCEHSEILSFPIRSTVFVLFNSFINLIR